jgi:hypothetical protein
MKINENDIVAVSTIDGVKYGTATNVEKNKVWVSVGGNTIITEPRHITRIYENHLLKKLKNERQNKS